MFKCYIKTYYGCKSQDLVLIQLTNWHEFLIYYDTIAGNFNGSHSCQIL